MQNSSVQDQKKQVYNFVYNTGLSHNDAKQKVIDFAASIQKELNQFEPKLFSFKEIAEIQQKFPFFYHFQLKPVGKILKRNELPFRVLRCDLSWRFKNLIDGEGVVYEEKDERLFEKDEVPVMNELLRANTEIRELKEKLRLANTQILDLQERILQLITSQHNILEEGGQDLEESNNNNLMEMVANKADSKSLPSEERESEEVLEKAVEEEKVMEVTKKIKKRQKKEDKNPSKAKTRQKKEDKDPSNEKLLGNYFEYLDIDPTDLSESTILDVKRTKPPKEHRLKTIQALKEYLKNKKK